MAVAAGGASATSTPVTSQQVDELTSAINKLHDYLGQTTPDKENDNG
jgi:hypothetical protein